MYKKIETIQRVILFQHSLSTVDPSDRTPSPRVSLFNNCELFNMGDVIF